nr:ABC transporter permease subunit [uncultured Blautia sp.]
MRRLLRANFSRLLKNKLFWILISIELFMGGLFPVLHYMDNIDEKSAWTMDSTIFIYTLFVPLMVSLLTALFIGSDYSDGTMRNKLIAGQVRKNIYAANLVVNMEAAFLLCFAFWISHVCIGTPLLGWFVSDAKKMLGYLLVTLTTVAACVAIFTLISMLCSNKAYSVAGCILIIFMLLFVGVRITAALNEPEMYDAYSYMSEGVTVQEDETPNPNYVSGVKRQIYNFLNEFLPGGQMIKLSNMNAEHLGRYAVYDGVIFAFVTGCGILSFRRKDLK